MVTEVTEGKLFFDFDIKQSLEEDVIYACRKKVEKAIDDIDEWKDGNNERNKWLSLWDVPTDHDEMHVYLNKKITKIANLTVDPIPPAPITYCYSGDSRICYHPHTVLLYGQPWVVNEKGEKMKIFIVLTYKTKCFPIPTQKSAQEAVV